MCLLPASVGLQVGDAAAAAAAGTFRRWLCRRSRCRSGVQRTPLRVVFKETWSLLLFFPKKIRNKHRDPARLGPGEGRGGPAKGPTWRHPLVCASPPVQEAGAVPVAAQTAWQVGTLCRGGGERSPNAPAAQSSAGSDVSLRGTEQPGPLQAPCLAGSPSPWPLDEIAGAGDGDAAGGQACAGAWRRRRRRAPRRAGRAGRFGNKQQACVHACVRVCGGWPQLAGARQQAALPVLAALAALMALPPARPCLLPACCLLVQIAKAHGAHVTTTCSTRNVEFLKGLGADEAIDYTQVHVLLFLRFVPVPQSPLQTAGLFRL